MSQFADVLSRFRVFPRLFSIAYLFLLFEASRWFMNLPAPSPEQSAFVATMVATAAAYFKFYVEGGQK